MCETKLWRQATRARASLLRAPLVEPFFPEHVQPSIAEHQRLAGGRSRHYAAAMVIIRFDDGETEKRALDFLVGRYSFKTWANGDLMLPEPALGALAAEGISFRVVGPATYEHFLPALRGPAATAL